MIHLQPRKAPIMAASFTSPPPIASFLKISEPVMPMTNIIPPPASTPKAESMNEIYGTKKLKINPITIPGKEMTSGTICSFKSIKAITIRADDKMI